VLALSAIVIRHEYGNLDRRYACSARTHPARSASSLWTGMTMCTGTVVGAGTAFRTGAARAAVIARPPS